MTCFTTGASGSGYNMFRVVWLALSGMDIKVIASAANSTDTNPILATAADNPDASGTQYTLITVPAMNGQFVTNGVQAGDTVRFQYLDDGFGNDAYQSYVVAAVVNQDELILVTGPGAAVTTPSRLEVWRTLDSATEAAEIAAAGGAWGDKRVRAVWPDTIQDGALTVPGYFACCAYAGLRSSLQPHQGMTNFALPGFSSVPRTTEKFHPADLDVMANSGVFIITQDASGKIFSRHALTTGDQTNIGLREEMLVTNEDDVAMKFRDLMSPYIGVVNAVPSLILQLNADANQLLSSLSNASTTPLLGGQLAAGATVTAAIDPVFRDKVNMQIVGVGPAPLNYLVIDITM